MNSSQLQELQKMKRLQQEMAQRRQQQQSGRQSSQGMAQPQSQLRDQRWLEQQKGNQQGGQRSSLTSMNDAALFLLQQQQQQQMGGGVRQMSALPSNAGSAQNALYWNAMQAKKAAGVEDAGNSQSTMGGMTNMNQTPNSASMQSLLQQQQKHLGSLSSLMGGMGNVQPQLVTGSTSATLLMQQQRIMADLKRRLQNRQGGGSGDMGLGGSQGSLMATHNRQRHSSPTTSLQGSQRQALFQMQQQRENSMSNALGCMQDQSRMPLSQNSRGLSSMPEDRRSSIGSVEPIPLTSLMGSQTQSARRCSSGSHACIGPSGGGGGSLLIEHQAQLLSELMPLQKDTPQSQHLLAGQAQLITGGGLQRRASDGGARLEASSELASSGSEKKRDSQSSTSSESLHAPGGGTAGLGTTAAEETFMNGTFEGGWQSNDDLPERRGIIFNIVTLIEQMRPDSDEISQK